MQGQILFIKLIVHHFLTIDNSYNSNFDILKISDIITINDVIIYIQNYTNSTSSCDNILNILINRFNYEKITIRDINHINYLYNIYYDDLGINGYTIITLWSAIKIYFNFIEITDVKIIK